MGVTGVIPQLLGSTAVNRNGVGYGGADCRRGRHVCGSVAIPHNCASVIREQLCYFSVGGASREQGVRGLPEPQDFAGRKWTSCANAVRRI